MSVYGWLEQELGAELGFSRGAASALTTESLVPLSRILLGD